MKKYFLTSIALVICAVFLSGCNIWPFQKDKDANTETKQTSDDSQYKLLYNSPAGGNPENKGKILFASNPSSTANADYDLFTINADGTNKTKITNFGKFVNHPVWSPDYSRIAFSSNVDNKHEKIFIMTADGSEYKQLTVGDNYDKFPTWSPDGKSIAYISYSSNDKIPNLFVMDDHGNNVKQLTFVSGKDTAVWPSWAPTGNKIAYTYNSGKDNVGARLHMINSDGSGDREIVSVAASNLGDSEPAFSPDGNTMYFISNRSSQLEIWKLDFNKWESVIAENGNIEQHDIGVKQISNLDSVNVNPDHRPRVSPDGTKIVFYGVGSDWNNIGTNLYTINIDGSGLTNITKSTDGNEWPDW